MSTVTKKELVERIASATGQKRVAVKLVVQEFLDQLVVELGRDNRLEFRDFGVFEVAIRQARMAQNPKTLEPVWVPTRRTVRFKCGRQMRKALLERDAAEEAGRLEADGAERDGVADGLKRDGVTDELKRDGVADARGRAEPVRAE